LPLLSFEKDGVEIRRSLISRDIIEYIKADIDLESEKLKKYGIRNLEKKFKSISDLSKDENILTIARNLLNNPVHLVRAIFFDKTPDKNWFVTWHQDKTVTLNKKIQSEGWGPWTIKDEIHHVQPPIAVLNSMITFRLHLDPADDKNGCLNVIPETHKLGILKQNEIDELVKTYPTVPCIVESSDAVIMRPHLLHSSSKAEKPDHRRVVHLEYSSYKLPDGVSWV